MGDRYTYFTKLLDECLDSVNQHKIKSELINSYTRNLNEKSENLQVQITDLQRALFLDDGKTQIDKLNHIKQLQIALVEKDFIIQDLKNEILSLKSRISYLEENGNNIDDLPF